MDGDIYVMDKWNLEMRGRFLTHTVVGFFGQFPKRDRQAKRVKKMFLRWTLKLLFETELVWTEWTDGE